MINVPVTFPEGLCQRSFKGLNLDTASETKNSGYFSKNFFPTTEGLLTWTHEVLLGFVQDTINILIKLTILAI